MTEVTPEKPEATPLTTEADKPAEKPKEKKIRSVDIVTKRDLMDTIQDAIAKHPRLPLAKLWNPYGYLATDGVKKATIEAPKSLSIDVPETITDDVVLATLKRQQALHYGLLKAEISAEVTAEQLERERDRRLRAYVQFGTERLPSFTSGNCSFFAAVTLGLLSKRVSELLPKDAYVELFGFWSSDGHNFLVVNRAGGLGNVGMDKGTVADLASWGAECFVIDQWYARQLKETPGCYAVKDVTGTEGDKYYDPAFNKFISERMRAPTRFSYALLADPRSPK